MATIGPTALTLADLAAMMGGDPIIEALAQSNEVLFDMPWIPSNSLTTHRSSVRTSIPQGIWRGVNQYIPTAKTTAAPIEDSAGVLDAFSEIDDYLIDLADDGPQVRMSEDMGFVEGLSQQVAQAIFYSSTNAAQGQIMGLAPRYFTVNAASAYSANNVIDCGGTGTNNTSIWLVVWDPNKTVGFYPKNTRAGLQTIDHGRQVKSDSNGNRISVMSTQFRWSVGLAVRDYRYVVRLANIDVPSLIANSGAQTNLIQNMIRALNKPPTMPSTSGPVQTVGAPGAATVNFSGRPVFYCNRTVRTWLQIQAVTQARMFLTMENFAGRTIPTFLGVPVRNVDQILNTEARVV